MPRTTLDLDGSVVRELRVRSRREGKSMGRLASELLVHALATPSAPAAPPFTWVSRSMGKPRVDLEDKEAVAALLDERP